MMEDPAPNSTHRDHLAEFGKVAGELVHDLANDMQVLQGWSALARMEADRGRIPTEEIERVNQLAEGLGRMLQDVLATVSNQALSPEVAFHPKPLTERTLADRLKDISVQDVRLRTRLGDDVQIAGRASFWVRIVGNLLRNAGRHARSRILVSLELHRDTDAGDTVVLRVEDDGPGISHELRAAVFEPLWRGSEGGAGLGLSSVVWTAGRLGGSVSYAADSVLGGAAFEVRVPASRPMVVRPHPPQRRPARLNGVRLVLIDDDSAIRHAVSRLLRRSGADVRDLDPDSLPEERLMEELASGAPDVILMDLNLRGRAGVTLWHRLRESSPPLADRVVFISGAAPGDQAWDDAQRTGRPVLAKPFDVQQLIELVVTLGRGG
jgi:CheY-like chemotaxis protein/two-component sensor histidine kinase